MMADHKIKINRATTVVHLAVQSACPDLVPGLVGDHPRLGAWNPKRAIQGVRDTVCKDIWHFRLVMPFGYRFEFKLIRLKDGRVVSWEREFMSGNRGMRAKERVMYVKVQYNGGMGQEVESFFVPSKVAMRTVHVHLESSSAIIESLPGSHMVLLNLSSKNSNWQCKTVPLEDMGITQAAYVEVPRGEEIEYQVGLASATGMLLALEHKDIRHVIQPFQTAILEKTDLHLLSITRVRLLNGLKPEEIARGVGEKLPVPPVVYPKENYCNGPNCYVRNVQSQKEARLSYRAKSAVTQSMDRLRRALSGVGRRGRQH